MEIIFVYKNVILGGCELLIAKLASEFLKFHQVKVICNTIDSSIKEIFKEKNIDFEQYEEWDLKKIVKNSKRGKSCYITFFFYDFLSIKANKNNFDDVYMYIVNPKILWLEKNYKAYIKRFLFRNIIRKSIDTKNFIFMDEQCLDSTIKSYKLNKKIYNKAKIIRISVDNIDNIKIKKRNRDKISLLSIARADFPFKGYLLGLLKWFNKYCNDEEKFELTIVSYGPDIDELNNEYNKINDNVRKRIHLFGKCDSKMLENFYINSDFYIGMGTTILEAAQFGCISFAVEPYKYDFVVNKSFDEIPNKVALLGDEENLVTNFKQNLMEIYANCYYEKSKKHQQKIKEMYSLERNAQGFIKVIEEKNK